jgi:hypothetical protein
MKRRGDMHVSVILFVIQLIILPAALYCAVFYVDPDNGSTSGDGSGTAPWKTLEDVFDSNFIESRRYESNPPGASTPFIVKNQGAPVKAGDTIMLRSGYHGDIYASAYYNSDYVTIMAQPGHTPEMSSIELRSGCKWIIKGLKVSPELAPSYEKTTLISFASHGWSGPSFDCIAESCTAYSVLDASSWTADDWNNLSCNAMSLSGNNLVARGNYFKNVNFGISVSGDSCLVEYNTVENFAGDGLRGLGNYDVFQYNTVKNCYDVNANHDDGFQSWSRGSDNQVGTGVVKGMVLRGNTIINYEDPNQPFRGTLQGIGCFDGMFEDWLVENNVIITDHWHGITLLGATNCVIINNTVLDVNTERPGPPWISIDKHKNGTLSSGCIVRNNLSTSFDLDTASDITDDHNIRIVDPGDFFVNPAEFNVQLIPGCAAIDSGSSNLAPSRDIIGTSRPWGSGVDIGAYESFVPGQTRDFSMTRGRTSGPDFRVYPNPFSTSVKIQVLVRNAECGMMNMGIYDISGRLVYMFSTGGVHTNSANYVRTPPLQYQFRIPHSAFRIRYTWIPSGYPSGVYVITLTAGQDKISKKVIYRKN